MIKQQTNLSNSIYAEFVQNGRDILEKSNLDDIQKALVISKM